MSGILLYADKPHLFRELRTAADIIADGAPIKALACTCDHGADQAGAADTYKVEIEAVDAASIASIFADAASMLDCDTILVAFDRRGKDVTGRLAQKLGAGVLTGVTSIALEDGAVVASYPSLGGAVENRAVITSDVKVFALAPNAFAEAPVGAYSVETLAIEHPASRVVVGEEKPKEGSSVDVAAAEILFVVGCGVEQESSLGEIESCVAKLGGVVGCTKPVSTDRKWFSEDRIIGISGKTCKPRLAVLLGVSGQVQFWAGIRDADTIVSLNTDEHAAIASMADCSVVCDAVEGVREFASLA